MVFRERLRALRKEEKLTQSRLAQILNYGSTAISNYESGRNEPSISDLKKIACFFNVSMDYLLCVNDIRNPYVEKTDAGCFENFYQDYCALTEENAKEAKKFIRYLLFLQEGENESDYQYGGNLKVAEPQKKYE